MRGSKWLLALGCGLMLSTSGCCGGVGGCGQCCDTCGGGCNSGPVYRRPVRQPTGDDCGACGGCREGCDSCCDPCGGDCCQRNFCFHPLRALGRLFFIDSYCGPRCGGGCGDDCSSCGSGCGGSGQGSAPAMGGQYGYASPRPGCKNCNRNSAAYDSGEMSGSADGEEMQGEASPEPTPAPTTTKTSRRPSQQTPTYN